MSAEYHKTRGSLLLCIRSRDLSNTPANGYNSSGRFNLFEDIVAEPEEVLSVKLLSAIIPNSWYNLDSQLNNNTVMVTEKRVSDDAELSYTITIPNGSYNIDELNAKMKTLMDTTSASSGYSLTYTFAYDEATNADTITSSDPTNYQTTFKFSESNSARRFLGFTSENKTITSSSGIVSDRAVDVTDTYNSIYIRIPNLNSQKVVESYSTKYSNVVAQIPIQFSRNTLMIYEPNNPFEMEIKNDSISSFFITITFQDESQAVNFGSGDWEINLQIDYYRKKEHRLQHTIHQNIKHRYEKYQRRKAEEQRHIRELEDFVVKRVEQNHTDIHDA